MRASSISVCGPRWLLHGALIALLGLGASACSWSRFDDVTSNSPDVLLEKPGSMKQGFGVSVATASSGSDVQVLIGGGVGVSGASRFDIGDAESPSTTAIDTGYCTGSGGICYLSSSLAALPNAAGPDGDHTMCFAVGAGTESPAKGLVVRCEDATEYAIGIPAGAEAALDFAIDTPQPDDFPLASDRTDSPSLLASSPSGQVAWFYPPLSTKFSQLVPPFKIKDATFGKTLAVLAMGDSKTDGRIYAVGLQSKNAVLLWKTEDGGSVSKYIGCLGGTSGFGRAMAGGKVSTDDKADLVVSDDVDVHVIDGAALFDLPETTSADCSFASLPPGALLNSFGCGTTSSLSGCADSEFGASVAVGDLDNDGDGEVIVGAPSMTVRDNSGAGAVLVFDADSSSDSAFVDAKFISSAEDGDNLGRTLATPHVAGRDIILAGAPGNGKAALFYCSALLKAGAAGSRCP